MTLPGRGQGVLTSMHSSGTKKQREKLVAVVRKSTASPHMHSARAEARMEAEGSERGSQVVVVRVLVRVVRV